MQMFPEQHPEEQLAGLHWPVSITHVPIAHAYPVPQSLHEVPFGPHEADASFAIFVQVVPLQQPSHSPQGLPVPQPEHTSHPLPSCLQTCTPLTVPPMQSQFF